MLSFPNSSVQSPSVELSFQSEFNVLITVRYCSVQCSVERVQSMNPSTFCNSFRSGEWCELLSLPLCVTRTSLIFILSMSIKYFGLGTTRCITTKSMAFLSLFYIKKIKLRNVICKGTFTLTIANVGQCVCLIYLAPYQCLCLINDAKSAIRASEAKYGEFIFLLNISLLSCFC